MITTCHVSYFRARLVADSAAPLCPKFSMPDGQSANRESGSQRVGLERMPNGKGWNSRALGEFPGHLDSMILSLRILRIQGGRVLIKGFLIRHKAVTELASCRADHDRGNRQQQQAQILRPMASPPPVGTHCSCRFAPLPPPDPERHPAAPPHLGRPPQRPPLPGDLGGSWWQFSLVPFCQVTPQPSEFSSELSAFLLVTLLLQ